MIPIKRRCKFYDTCHLADAASRTCTQDAGGDYCGAYRTLLKLQKEKEEGIKTKEKIVWKDKSKRVVLKSVIIGHFAMWAVRQSPYLLPESLEEGIREFGERLVFKKKIGDEELIETTYKDLKGKISGAILNSSIISSWNIAKKGSGPVFVSSYSYPKSDYDFIDLDALARNIAQSVWLEIFYNDGGFE